MSAGDTDAPEARADSEPGTDGRSGGSGGGGGRPQPDRPGGQDRGPRQDDGPAAPGGPPEDELFGDSETDPSAKEGRAAAGGAAARIARESRAFFLRDSSTYVGGTIGAVNFRFGDTARASLLAGPLPEDELRRLRRRFTRPPDYEDFKRQLRDDRLLVLCGQPGSGRTYTALSLLDDLTRGKVSRLDPGSDLAGLDSDDEGGRIAEGHGYTLEPADGRLPGELHLDRLCRLLADRGAYAVLLSVPAAGVPGAPQARYRRAHTPAAEDAVLDGHLTAELDSAPAEAREAARLLARRDTVRAALGLEALLPAEAARLAGLVARQVTGELTEEELLTACRGFAAEQVREWFAGGTAAETLPALRDAAYRIALAVFGNSSFNVAAEAAELLTWELAVTADPERVPGRPLLGDGLETRLTSARATTRISLQPVVAGEDIPVRTVRFLGPALAPALLAHLWEHHHNMRGPVLRWLDSLCGDPREDVWTRAAVAAGELCRLDCAHTLGELLIPMAESDQARRGLFVATALQDVLDDPAVGEALRSLVKNWGARGDGNLRWTAAAVLSRGTATRTMGEALGRLGRIGTWEDGRLRSVAAQSVAHLAGSASGREPLARIRAWLGDSRRQHQNLGLVSTLFLAETLVENVWNPAAELAGHGKWPLALAICATRPDQASEVAGLLWTALNTSRSYRAALDAVATWLRTCPGKPWEAAVLGFLPLLVLTDDDRQRMLSLIGKLSQDPDDPLAQEYAHRLLQTVRTGRTR
ncbi:hypothetical protein [Streptomyces pini]|uniref:Uncharacterized protein n=1 Tax=Streptomyces pini TaxID=1520580 RepID=A0A1I3VGG1_9ACTN|nr:hypothetical protein [Streptomyces pini]SFJ94260.1 hypothetical protein SAMN05192584_102332 [Streptomyces pini]